MKRPTELISKIKHCFNGEFQDLHDYIIFLENLTKMQRAKTIETIVDVDEIIQAKINQLEELASLENSEGRWVEEEKYLFAKECLEKILEKIKNL